MLWILRQAARHASATGVLAAVLALTAGVSYVALLLIAIVTNQGLGGPLALPFMVLCGAVAGVLLGPLLLLPVTAITEWLCRRPGMLRLAAQIPLSTILASLVIVGLSVEAARRGGLDLLEGAVLVLVSLAVGLFALGVYWWVLRLFDLLTWPVRRLGGLLTR